MHVWLKLVKKIMVQQSVLQDSLKSRDTSYIFGARRQGVPHSRSSEKHWSLAVVSVSFKNKHVILFPRDLLMNMIYSGEGKKHDYDIC